MLPVQRATLTEPVKYCTRSAWAEIRQRSLVGSHPLKIQETGPPLFSFILSLKCLVIMFQLTHVTTSRYTRPHAEEMMAVHESRKKKGLEKGS